MLWDLLGVVKMNDLLKELLILTKDDPKLQSILLKVAELPEDKQESTLLFIQKMALDMKK